jgi:hypothetical protein
MEIINVKVFTLLLLLESFLLCYIALDTLNLLLILGFFGVLLIYIIILMSLYASFDIPLKFVRNVKQFHTSFKLNTKNVIIGGFLGTEIILAIFFVIYNVDINAIVIVYLLLDGLVLQFIIYSRIQVWGTIQKVIYFVTRLIIIYSQYLYLNWVVIVLVIQVIVLITMFIDQDFVYLQAFVPDVLYIMSVYDTIWVIPVAIILFCYYATMYVFESE